jgi:hypothetical protein
MMAFLFLQTLRCEEKKRPLAAAVPSSRAQSHSPCHDSHRDLPAMRLQAPAPSA